MKLNEAQAEKLKDLLSAMAKDVLTPKLHQWYKDVAETLHEDIFYPAEVEKEHGGEKEWQGHFDMCSKCINNTPGYESGLWCINNCISGSKFQPSNPQPNER